MDRIDIKDLERLIADPSVPDAVILRYLKPGPQRRPGMLDPTFEPDPDRVLVKPSDGKEGARIIALGNDVARARRRVRFEWRRRRGDKRPLIVSEGDSWFQFPFALHDVIDHLEETYLIRSLGAAADTARNMIIDKPEYLDALKEHAGDVRAFLLSAAGNDIIGEDSSGKPTLLKLIRPSRKRAPGVDDLIDREALAKVTAFLRSAYETVFRSIRETPSLGGLPIIVHGYDYPIPYPGGANDPRKPFWANRDEWLGSVFSERGIGDRRLRGAVMRRLIDALYDMLHDLSKAHRGVHVVDLRNTLTRVGDWADEIHPTDDGFAMVARRFASTLAEVAGADRDGFELALAPAATVVIDPGHGGEKMVGGSSPNNAVGPNGTKEKDLTLAVSGLVDAELGRLGFESMRTRTKDKNLSLAARAKAAKSAAADVFLSIHFNGWSDPRVQGTECYHHSDANGASRRLANHVQSAVQRATGLADRGVKHQRFGVLRPDRHDPLTAAALLEISFLTDPAEEARLADGSYLQTIATAIAKGIEDYLEADGAEDAERPITWVTPREELSFGPDLEDGIETPTFATPRRPVVQSELASPPLLLSQLPETVDEGRSPTGIEDDIKFSEGFAKLAPPPAADGKEALVGADDTLPAVFLKGGAQVGSAVCKIEAAGVNYQGVSGSWHGTGFLIAPGILLTNHHVINSVDVARRSEAIFGYEETGDRRIVGTETYNVNPDRLFLTCGVDGGRADLDYTFVWVDGAPEERWGMIPMWRGSYSGPPEAGANIIHHPGGDPKRISIRENRIFDLGHRELLLHYRSDTKKGSSGAPVFDDNWRLLALHHAHTLVADAPRVRAGGVDGGVVNEGVRISAITIDVEQRANFPHEAAAAREIASHFIGTDSRTGFFGQSGRRPLYESNGTLRVETGYRGAPDDVDIGLWETPLLRHDYRRSLDLVVKVLADLNLDIWILPQTTLAAAEAVADRMRSGLGLDVGVDVCVERRSRNGLNLAVIWNRQTVEGGRSDWPDGGRPSVQGDLTACRPFTFRALNRGDGLVQYDFMLVPTFGDEGRTPAAEVRLLAAQAHNAARRAQATGAWRDALFLGGWREDARFAEGAEDLIAEGPNGEALALLKAGASPIDAVYLSPQVAIRSDPAGIARRVPERALSTYSEDAGAGRMTMVRLRIADQ